MLNYSEALTRVRKDAPLVQCITNFVTVNDCANIILAAGGSPSMAHDIREVKEAVTGVHSLVCNMGAIADADAMVIAGRQANELGKPVILDPVAAGGTKLRRDTAQRILKEVQFSVIRGNASEIRSLAGEQVTGSGVDASRLDFIRKDNLGTGIRMVCMLARQTGAVIAMSGEMDIISDGNRTVIIHNGCQTMARITGSGCMLASLIGTFCGASPEDIFDASCAAIATMGLCGEIAERQRLTKGTGNATYRTDLIDAVFNLTEQQLKEGARYEIL